MLIFEICWKNESYLSTVILSKNILKSSQGEGEVLGYSSRTITTLEGNSTHRPIRRTSMLFIVVRKIRQCTELPVVTVYFHRLCSNLFQWMAIGIQFIGSSILI